MRKHTNRLGFFDIDWSSARDTAMNIGRQVGGELTNQGLIEAQVALLKSTTPKYTLNADYAYCKADPTDPTNMTCDVKSIWFPRIAQYAYPNVTPVKELNTLAGQFGIAQRVTQPNESALADLSKHVFYKAAESVAGKSATSVSEPQAREIARLAFTKVESARSVKIGDKTYTRGDIMGMTKQIPNDIEIDGIDSAGIARMTEGMTAIEDSILSAPGVKDGVLSQDVAKHVAATVGPKHIIPRFRIYLTPDRSEFVEYTAAANKVRVVTKGGEKTFSVEECILPADKLPKPSGGGGGSVATGTASGAAATPTEKWYKTWWGVSGIVAVVGGGAYLVHRHTAKAKKQPSL